MHILPKGGPKAFEAFMRALISQGHDSAADALDEELARRLRHEGRLLSQFYSSLWTAIIVATSRLMMMMNMDSFKLAQFSVPDHVTTLPP